MRLMPPQPVPLSKKKRRTRKRVALPPPTRSARLYLYIDPSKVHLFRYLLEAEDNLGIMTVVDRWRAALMVRFSPHQERRMRQFLEEARVSVPFDGPIAIPLVKEHGMAHSRKEHAP